MPSKRDIDDQQKLLQEYRDQVQHYRELQATLGKFHVPPEVPAGIKAALTAIRPIKAWLRQNGVPVEDLPGEDEGAEVASFSAMPASAPPSPPTLPSLTPLEAEVADLPGDEEAPELPRWGLFPTILVGVFLTIVAIIWFWPRIVRPPDRLPNPIACPQSIRFGEVITCSLSESGAASYTFDAAQDDQVLIVVAQASEVTAIAIEPSFILSSLNGATISECDASHTGLAEKICRLPQTGTYELRVKGKSSAGNLYRVWVQRLNNPGLATPIAMGVTFSGAITRAAQFDTYVIDASGATRIAIQVDPNVAGKNSTLEPWFAIYDASGNPLPGRCEGESSSVAEGLCGLPSAGRYTMLVAAKRRDSTGPYVASVTRSR